MRGLTLWLWQRGTSVYMLLYIAYVGLILCTHSSIMTYDFWFSWIMSLHMKIATFLAVILLTIHAWIGVWGILTDYVKSTSFRLTFFYIYTLLLAVSLLTNFLTFWR
jgi:succinate dehydrogenase / fumarate reductase membrane anchor subunit